MIDRDLVRVWALSVLLVSTPLLLLLAQSLSPFANKHTTTSELASELVTSQHNSELTNEPPMAARIGKTAFGAGCFWGTEKFFRRKFKDALVTTSVGYMGGKKPAGSTVSYEEVCSGQTGHAEVLYVEYNEDKVKYKDLVTFFFRMHDPTTLNRQQGDRGTQYRSAIFYYTEEQKKIAEEAKVEVASKFKDPIVTTINPADTYYKAEDYHQLYLEKNPGGYCSHKLQW